ncbi:Endoribonuclease L-PSP [Plasmodiophora brassicae]|uniref:Uncharacterized protein n=1 Tax=Plasmodiophora brassicae TaxID=37360 RepID=A0A0G4IZ96_PLABS|nr:hypothetical protein PBRA_001440 [Plasmodiophora brassicae]SPQ94104.1 unnamed protein product [Plasmodiophora brassicae]
MTCQRGHGTCDVPRVLSRLTRAVTGPQQLHFAGALVMYRWARRAYRAVVATPDAPKAIGPYSQAVRANGFLFVSGMIGFVPETMELASKSDVKLQTEQALKNMVNVLRAGGSNPDKVVKTTVLMTDMDNYKVINEVYAKFFTKDFPARAAFAVKALPANALVEIECVAMCEED